MKTSELTGAALDWAVAKCEPDDTLAIYFDEDTGEPLRYDDWENNQEYKPSTDWTQGGPIIERKLAKIERFSDSLWEATAFTKNAQDFVQNGPTPLIAAMRCYVASKMGDNIDIPKELTL
jgi:hypothetical protein